MGGGTFLLSIGKWGVHFSFLQNNGVGTFLVFVSLTMFLLMERFELQSSRSHNREFTGVSSIRASRANSTSSRVNS